MRQSEARDLRSFLAEPVEEFVEVAPGKREEDHVGARFIIPSDRVAPGKPENGNRSWDGNMSWDNINISSKDTNPFLQNSEHSEHEGDGVQFITPWRGTEEQLPGTGVRFAIPWEGTGGQLHEVGTRFTSPLTLENDLALQQTLPMPQVVDASRAQSGLSALRPHRLQRYQSRGIPVALSRSTSGTLRLRPAGERRATADLAPAPHKIVPGEPSPALQSWERKRHTIYTWLILLTLFLLVILGGIGLDSLIASYR